MKYFCLLALGLSCGPSVSSAGLEDAGIANADAGATMVPDSGSAFDAGLLDTGSTQSDAGSADSGVGDAGLADAGGFDAGPNPWADRLVRFEPGPGAGFGQEKMPEVVLGPPQGGGLSMGSLDVVSLGQNGRIELEFTDLVATDGPGPDLAVYENPFSGFAELARVSVSDDGTTWRDFPCEPNDRDAGYPGCAGVRPVLRELDGGVASLGGDLYDLSTVGLSRARFIRITDIGSNRFYAPPSGGFDLDACAVLNGMTP
jgi:hypothetical protein